MLQNDVHVLLGDVLAEVESGVVLGKDGDVLEVYAVDGHLGQTVELHGVAGMLADDVTDVDVAEDGRLFSDGNHRCGGDI